MTEFDSNEEFIIDKLLDEEGILANMLGMPDRMNEQLPRARREEVFSFLWEHTDMKQKGVLDMVEAREQQIVDKYNDVEIPEWLLRLHAQDILLHMIHEEFEKGDLI